MDAPAPYAVRLARPGEVDRLPAIELAAAQLFRKEDVGEASLADTQSVETLAQAQRAGRLWVAVCGDEPVGFALGGFLGREPYLREIDVLPAHGRRGLGAALVAAVIAWARAAGGASLVLSTFRDIAWNAPFYAKLGFRALDVSELDAEHRALFAREAQHGLPIERRVVMRLDLASGA